MADGYVIAHGYGRCIEGYRLAGEQLARRYKDLRYAGMCPSDIADDLEYLALQADQAAWARLMAETPRFVEAGNG